MKLGQAVKMAAKSIFSNVGRSALTMLGIIIGLAAVIILVSYAQGQNAAMRAYYESMGTNTVQVSASTWDASLDVSQALYSYCLGLDDLVEGVTPAGQANASAISYGSKTLTSDDWNTMTTVYLGSDQYGRCSDYHIARGRDLSILDVEKLSQVCVLGSATAEELFSFADPLDKTITINGIPFRVIGVYQSKAAGVTVGSKEEDQYLLDEIRRQDRMVLLPHTMTRYFNNNQPIDQFVVKVKGSDAIAPTVTALNGFLSGVIPSDYGYFRVDSPQTWQNQQNQADAIVMQLLNHRTGYVVVYKDADRVVALCHSRRLRSQIGTEILDFAVVGSLALISRKLAEKDPVVILCSKEGNFQNLSRSLFVEAVLQHLQNRFVCLLFIRTLDTDFQGVALFGVQSHQLQNILSRGRLFLYAHRNLAPEIRAALGQQGAGPGVNAVRVGNDILDFFHYHYLLVI